MERERERERKGGEKERKRERVREREGEKGETPPVRTHVSTRHGMCVHACDACFVHKWEAKGSNEQS